MQNDKFGRLLKGAINSIASYEHKTAPIIEDELGRQIGVSAASIQRYKAGHIPPEPNTVQVLAETAVKRGYLNREWLQNFLGAARYPTPLTLVEKFYPNTMANTQPSRVYHNLPAPTYSQFIMREEAYAEVLEGLAQRSAVVVITSLGGMGKTSLAREVAAQCLQKGLDNNARFEAVVWVSDKDRPGTTRLSTVLDEVARTLDYPGFTQLPLADKRSEVEQLLRRQRVLLVVDNFETIQDQELLAWLLRLPEPSKTLITTREYRREFRWGTWPVELRGMNQVEAQKLISQRLRLLKMDSLVNNPTQLELLLVATGGNAKAIEMALGCLKYERQGLQKVLDDLYEARSELFKDLFSRSWELLDIATRRVLLAMPLFANSATYEALAATSDLASYAFDIAVERLTDLTLLDVQHTDLSSSPRYTLHPLVRTFAQARLDEQPELDEALHTRWTNWYIELAAQVGYCWEDISRLDLLDEEQETIQTVINWTLNKQQYAQTIQLTRGAGYFYYIRGFWEKKPPINLMGAKAARALGDRAAEAEALAFLIQLLSKQGKLAEAGEYFPRLHELAATTELPPDIWFMYQHAVGLYWLAHHDLAKAQAVWLGCLEMSEKLSPHLHITNRRWLAICWNRQGRWQEARQLSHTALDDALHYCYKEGEVVLQILLASFDLEAGDFESAAKFLKAGLEQARRYQYRDHLAQIEFLYARLYALRGEHEQARIALNSANDLFERLGMRYELAEVVNGKGLAQK
jgi:LuxR family glucitol operon transcriptional activator